MDQVLYIGFAQADEWDAWAPVYDRHETRFEEASGRQCRVVSYLDVTLERVREWAPRAIVMSGFARCFVEYPPREFLGVVEVMREPPVPTLCVCGSHQLLAFAWTRDLRQVERLVDEPMRLARVGEPHADPPNQEYYFERGFRVMTLHREDPLFAGCGYPPVLYESHFCEVKQLPEAFALLASSAECRVEAMRHRELPLYGVQFHPEDWNDEHPDGHRLLQAFFALA